VKRFISHSMPKSRGTFSAVSNHRKVKTVVANCGNQQHCTNYTVQGGNRRSGTSRYQLVRRKSELIFKENVAYGFRRNALGRKGAAGQASNAGRQQEAKTKL